MHFWPKYSGVSKPRFESGRNWFHTGETKSFIWACVNACFPGMPHISLKSLSPRVFNLSCACTCYVTLPSSHPEEAARRSLLRAAVERDGIRGEPYGKSLKQRMDRWNIWLWLEPMEFPVELEKRNTALLSAEITCSLLDKTSRVLNKHPNKKSISHMTVAYGRKHYSPFCF